MDRPWGLSGPGFLVLYGAAFTLVCVAALAAKWMTKRSSLEATPSHLSLYEWAYLHGGETSVAEAAVAGLLQSRRVRVNRTRRLHVAGQAAGDEFQQLVMAEIPQRNRLPKLSRYLKRSGACQPLVEKLRAEGLLIQRPGHLAVRGLWLLFPTLALIALARIVTGIVLDHPVGILIFELAVVIVVSIPFKIMSVPPLRTVAGDKLVRASTLRFFATGELQYPDKPEISEPSGPQRVGTTAALAVAEAGMTAYPGKKIARLFASKSTGGGGSTGGSGGGGGGGCGGGGA